MQPILALTYGISINLETVTDFITREVHHYECLIALAKEACNDCLNIGGYNDAAYQATLVEQYDNHICRLRCLINSITLEITQ